MGRIARSMWRVWVPLASLSLGACGGGGGGEGPQTTVRITSAAAASCTHADQITYSIVADIVRPTGPTTYSANGLPSGLTLSGAQISGTCPSAGNYSITLSATNNGRTGTQVLTLVAHPRPAAVITLTPTSCMEPWASDTAQSGFVAVCSFSLRSDQDITLTHIVVRNVSDDTLPLFTRGRTRAIPEAGVLADLTGEFATPAPAAFSNGVATIAFNPPIPIPSHAPRGLTLRIDTSATIPWALGESSAVLAMEVSVQTEEASVVPTVLAALLFRERGILYDARRGHVVSLNLDTGEAQEQLEPFDGLWLGANVLGDYVLTSLLDDRGTFDAVDDVWFGWHQFPDGTSADFLDLAIECDGAFGPLVGDPIHPQVVHGCEGATDLWTAAIDFVSHAGVVQLTNDAAFEWSPTFDPVASRLAYYRCASRDPLDSTLRECTIHIASLDLGNPAALVGASAIAGGDWTLPSDMGTRFVASRLLSFGPTGAELLVNRYESGMFHLYRLRTDGTAITPLRLSGVVSPLWLADGRIAFRAPDAVNEALFNYVVAEPDGTFLRELPPLLGTIVPPCFSFFENCLAPFDIDVRVVVQ